MSSANLASVTEKVQKIAKENQNAVIGVGAAVGGILLTSVAVKIASIVKHRKLLNAVEAAKEDTETVHLYIMPRCNLSVSVSVPCSRLETFLRIAKIPHEVHQTMDFTVSPTCTLPFIAFRGQVIGDSEVIIPHLAKEFSVRLDRNLTKEENAVGLATKSMLSNSVSRGFYRSLVVDHYGQIVPHYAKALGIPSFVAYIGAKGMRAQIIEMMNLCGYGDLSRSQYEEELKRDIVAVEHLIGTKPFLFGNAPTTYDCLVYAWLLPFYRIGNGENINDAFLYVQQSPALANYLQNMTALAFPDLEELLNPTPAAPPAAEEEPQAEEEAEAPAAEAEAEAPAAEL